MAPLYPSFACRVVFVLYPLYPLNFLITVAAAFPNASTLYLSIGVIFLRSKMNDEWFNPRVASISAAVANSLWN